MKREIKAKYKEIPLDSIVEPDGRLRLEINQEEIDELANSIQSLGLRQAIEVVSRDDKYEVVYGERRVLAHRALGLDKIWAKVVVLTVDEIALVRAMENVARTNLSPIEEAASFADLAERFQMSVAKIAKKLGRSAGNVKRRLNLLKMGKVVQKEIHAGRISIAVAEELWRCPDEAHRDYLLQLAVEHGVTRDVVRQWVQDFAKKERSSVDAGRGGGGDLEPMQSKTIYHTCEICDGATSVSEIETLMVCKGCGKKIKEAIR